MKRDPALAFVSEATLKPAEFVEWLAGRPDTDIHRYELLGGRVVMTPPSSWPEGEGETNMIALLRAFVRERNLGRVFGSSQGYELPTGDTVAPDVSFVSAARWEAGPRPQAGEFLRIVPDLVVEVLAPGTERRDRVDKRIAYALAGVREYWLVDLRRREVTVYEAEAEGRFRAGRVLDADGTLTAAVLPGFSVALAGFFRDIAGGDR